MSHLKRIITAGFAVFSMFFGSGNLVFPIEVGTQSLGAYVLGIWGILISGIGMPILGMVSILVCGGDTRAYMQRLGTLPALVLMLTMLALMGPFGVGARCLQVAHGGVALVWPQVPFLPFAVVFGGLATLFAYRRRYVIEGIGRVLSPVLLIGIGLLFARGLGQSTPAASTQAGWEVFKSACLKGYEMMDLLAAFFFSATVARYLKEDSTQSTRSLHVWHGLGACFVGAALLALVYVGFVRLGAQYAPELSTSTPTTYLPTIAQLCLGSLALPVASLTIALACLTTLIVLVRLFATFLQRDLTRGRLPTPWALALTLGCTLLTSSLGFAALSNFLAQALTIAYPALVAFALVSILDKVRKTRWSAPVFWASLGLSIAIQWIT